MKIACVILGTRGDVQPMVALADGLIKRGHELTICAPSENEELAGKINCRFVPFGPGIKKSIKEKPEEQKGGVAVKITPAQGKKLIGDQINLLPSKISDSDLILGAGIVVGVHTAADILKIPYRLVAFYPIILGTTPDDPLKNRMMFSFGKRMMNIAMKGFINKFRREYGLPPISDLWSHWMGENVIIACDSEISPVREGVAYKNTQTASMMMRSAKTLSPEIEEFINQGKPPVYIGFGSNPIKGVENYNSLFEKVNKATGQRLLISKGWAGLPDNSNSAIMYADDMPFDLLFPKVAAVIYHGGAGTMAAVSRAGIPQAAFPFMADQFDNRKNIVRLGLGPDTCDFKKITADSISEAIMQCLTNDKFRENARIISESRQKENGTELTMNLIEREFMK